MADRRHDTRPALRPEHVELARQRAAEQARTAMPERPRWSELEVYRGVREALHKLRSAAARDELAVRLLLDVDDRARRDDAVGLNVRVANDVKRVPGSASADDGGKS
jgi:hypothetical protein